MINVKKYTCKECKKATWTRSIYTHRCQQCNKLIAHQNKQPEETKKIMKYHEIRYLNQNELQR